MSSFSAFAVRTFLAFVHVERTKQLRIKNLNAQTGRINMSSCSARVARELPSGSQSHSRSSFLCVCACVLFVNEPSMHVERTKELRERNRNTQTGTMNMS